jgi:hypothetical protein
MRNSAPPSKKRKIAVTAPEKIEFDFSAREEYLTGFHKRKLARIKHAQEENAKREKEEKLRFRREVREAPIPSSPKVTGKQDLCYRMRIRPRHSSNIEANKKLNYSSENSAKLT